MQYNIVLNNYINEIRKGDFDAISLHTLKSYTDNVKYLYNGQGVIKYC